ncbi:MAG: hypothetical protein AB1742_07195, partial [bacterium]
QAPGAEKCPEFVRVQVGGGLMVRGGGNLKLFPEGELQLTGTAASPALKGALYSERGFVRPGYSDIVFQVIEPVVIGFYSPEGMGTVPIFYAHGRGRVSGLDVYMESSGPMIDIGGMPVYRELCQAYTVGGLAAGAAAGEAPKIAVGEREKVSIPICPTIRLYAFEDNDPANPELSVQEIMAKITHTEELRAGTPVSRVLAAGAFGMFTPEIGSIVEQTINLENFRIDIDPNKDIHVQLEKRLADRLYVRLERLFSQPVQQDLEMRYRFRGRSFLMWSVDQDNESTYEVEYRITF